MLLHVEEDDSVTGLGEIKIAAITFSSQLREHASKAINSKYTRAFLLGMFSLKLYIRAKACRNYRRLGKCFPQTQIFFRPKF
jgi:hypothetical protein